MPNDIKIDDEWLYRQSSFFATEFQPLKVSNVPGHRMGLDHPNSAIEYHVGPK
jgi:hypothetical protein